MQRKLQAAIFAVAAVSGRSFVVVETVLAATLPSQATAWLSLITTHIVSQNAVVKWKEVTEGGVNDMWNPETIARVHANLSQFEASQLQKKKEAEKKIEESGIAECVFCQEEVMKNHQQVWESSSLLAYCIKARDHKHSPKIRWEKE